MTIEISTELMRPHHSYEFIGWPKRTFEEPPTDFSAFFNSIDSEDPIKQLKIPLFDEIFTELDLVDRTTFLEFDGRNVRKVEYHGEISYIRRATLQIEYKGKWILLKNIQFIKHMRRVGHESAIFEFKVDFREDLINKSIPEFVELRDYLAQQSAAYRGIFLIGNELVPNAENKSLVQNTVNKYFLSFFDKSIKEERRYTEAFEAIDKHEEELKTAVREDKGDVLNVN